jgi:hypothetical protein
LKVSVTDRDIEDGARVCVSRCPIATAIKRAHGNRDAQVAVITTRATIRENYNQNKGIWLTVKNYTLPPEAQEFIADFDAAHPVQPFEFEV